MEELLTPVSRSYRPSSQNDELLSLSKTTDKPAKPQASQLDFKKTSPQETLDTLKSQPGYETLVSVLNYLQDEALKSHGFDVKKPSPLASQIIHTLVTEIVPNYWIVLQESSTGDQVGDSGLLADCLRSISGINATLAYTRALLKEAKSDPKNLKKSQAIFNLDPVLGLLTLLLQDEENARNIWNCSVPAGKEAQNRPLRQELIALLAGEKIISICAEAENVLRQAEKLQNYWMSDGKLYADWLGRSLVSWMNSITAEQDLPICSEIVSRALRLGHSDVMVRKLFVELLLRDSAGQALFGRLMNCLPPLSQRRIFSMALRFLSNILSEFEVQEGEEQHDALVRAASGALKTMIGTDETRKGYLVSWLIGATDAGIGEPCSIRRAAISAFSDDRETMITVLEKGMSQFGDRLYIQHSPVLQQEAHTQVLLLAAGYTHRISPIKLTMLLRSSSYLNAVSNRLAASQTRAQFLGMVVGEALSSLAHKKETKLDFKMDETQTEDAEWYKSLTKVNDKPGPIEPLRKSSYFSTPDTKPKVINTRPKTSSRPSIKQASRPARIPPKTGFVIEEVESDPEGGDEEDDDLVPYAKPDSDAEDSDDDPTLINRDKPKAPVYIRDLITYFRDTESYDKQKIALETAPVLIRRKANYGTEVSSHAEELATLLVGLQDKYDLDDFDNLRQQGMIAIVVAQPKKMAQWFAKTFFDGEYSLSQRASILIALGLSGREIAGFETSEYAAASSFPSKALPPKTEKHYIQTLQAQGSYGQASDLKALPPNALDNLAQTLSQTFLAPLAAEAADAATGPDALKLSSFTSRLQAAQQDPSANPGKASGKSKNKPRVRAIPNTTASLISSSFFFPLTARFQAVMHSSSFAGSRSIVFDPHLLSLYLKTLALLLHAAGPSTLSLPQMTAEFWDLLLGVRYRSTTQGELGVTQAALFGLVALLDVNDSTAGGDGMRGLCERHGREVVESSEWVAAVFHGTRGGDEGGGGQENEVKMLAAGVLIRLREAVDKYQTMLLGNLIGVS